MVVKISVSRLKMKKKEKETKIKPFDVLQSEMNCKIWNNQSVIVLIALGKTLFLCLSVFVLIEMNLPVFRAEKVILGKRGKVGSLTIRFILFTVDLSKRQSGLYTSTPHIFKHFW